MKDKKDSDTTEYVMGSVIRLPEVEAVVVVHADDYQKQRVLSSIIRDFTGWKKRLELASSMGVDPQPLIEAADKVEAQLAKLASNVPPVPPVTPKDIEQAKVGVKAGKAAEAELSRLMLRLLEQKHGVKIGTVVQGARNWADGHKYRGRVTRIMLKELEVLFNIEDDDVVDLGYEEVDVFNCEPDLIASVYVTIIRKDGSEGQSDQLFRYWKVA